MDFNNCESILQFDIKGIPSYISLCSVLRKVTAGSYIGGLEMSDI